jgi:hypothetical protein
MLDPAAAMRNMQLVLQPGGTAVIVGWTSTPETRSMSAAKARQKFPTFGADNIVRLAVASGLRIKSVTHITAASNTQGLILEHPDVFLQRLGCKLSPDIPRQEHLARLAEHFDPKTTPEDIMATMAVIVAIKK